MDVSTAVQEGIGAEKKDIRLFKRRTGGKEKKNEDRRAVRAPVICMRRALWRRTWVSKRRR